MLACGPSAAWVAVVTASRSDQTPEPIIERRIRIKVALLHSHHQHANAYRRADDASDRETSERLADKAFKKAQKGAVSLMKTSLRISKL
tara:strand:- start:57 stop:323 length:267 start_codon:yes stop_codon:yes gene_type:complete